MGGFDPVRHCGAKKKQGSGPCCRPKGWGTDHPGQGRCKLHGGGTKTHRAAAARERAEVAVATYGLPIELEPTEALLQEVHRTAGHVAWLAQEVAFLEREQVAHGLARTVELPDGTTRLEYAAGLSVWVRLYQSERDRLVRVAKAALDAGVAERQVRIAEAQARLLADVFGRVYADEELGLSDEQRERARVVTARHLRLIDGGKAA